MFIPTLWSLRKWWGCSAPADANGHAAEHRVERTLMVSTTWDGCPPGKPKTQSRTWSCRNWTARNEAHHHNWIRIKQRNSSVCTPFKQESDFIARVQAALLLSELHELSYQRNWGSYLEPELSAHLSAAQELHAAKWAAKELLTQTARRFLSHNWDLHICFDCCTAKYLSEATKGIFDIYFWQVFLQHSPKQCFVCLLFCCIYHINYPCINTVYSHFHLC